MITVPPCAANPGLFESTRPDDYMEARAICAGCPMLAECRDRLRDEMQRGTPSGTWAGELVVIDGCSSKVVLRSQPQATEASERVPGGCSECGRDYAGDNNAARGMCGRCYRIAWKAAKRGVPTSEIMTFAARRERHAKGAELIAAGWTLEGAAREVGMKPNSLRQALARVAKRGEQVAS